MGKIYKNGIEYGGGGGDSAGHNILDTDGNAMAQEDNLQFTGLDVTDDSANNTTDVSAFGLNADSLDDVMSAGIAGNQVASNGLVYSTGEQVVGKWVDGKPLYQKTYTGILPDHDVSRDNFIDISNLNMDKMISIEAVAEQLTSGELFHYQSPFYFPDGESSLCFNVWRRMNNYLGITLIFEALHSSPYWVTVRYTKSTD